MTFAQTDFEASFAGVLWTSKRPFAFWMTARCSLQATYLKSNIERCSLCGTEKWKYVYLHTGNNTSTVNASLWLGEDLQSMFIFVFLSKHHGFACKEILFSCWRECTSLFSFKQFCWAAAQVWLTFSSYSMAVNHCEMLLKARQRCRGQVLHGEGGEEFSLISLASKPECGFSWEATAMWRGKFKSILPGIALVAASWMFSVQLLKILPAAALHNLGFHWRS